MFVAKIKNKFLFFSLLAIFISANIHSQKTQVLNFEVGSKIPKRFTKECVGFILCSPSQSYPFFETTIDGIKYKIAFNDNKVEAIFTECVFLDETKISSGMTVEKLLKIVPNLTFTKIIGWGYYAQLQNGWNVLVCVGQTATEKYPSANDTVNCFYKTKNSMRENEKITMELDYSYFSPWQNKSLDYNAKILDTKIIVTVNNFADPVKTLELSTPPLAEKVFNAFIFEKPFEPEIIICDYDNDLTLTIGKSTYNILSENDDFTKIHPPHKNANLLIELHKYIIEKIEELQK